MIKPTYFKTPEAFRNWLKENHLVETELWVGFYKKATGLPSINWSESVDQALCFGWIDGIRKKVDDKSYMIRFTPRRPKSHWSAVNIEKIKTLKAKKLLYPAGIEAYKKMDPINLKKASYEQKMPRLAPHYEKQFKLNEKAWAFFQNLAPGYKKHTIYWVMSAKKEATRLRRLQVVIDAAAQGLKIPALHR